MTTDRFVLRDEFGKVLAEKSMVEHIKVFIDEMKPDAEQRFMVKSEVSGYVFEVTDKTTQSDWREYADKCLMALELDKDYDEQR